MAILGRLSTNLSRMFRVSQERPDFCALHKLLSSLKPLRSSLKDLPLHGGLWVSSALRVRQTHVEPPSTFWWQLLCISGHFHAATCAAL